MQASEMTLLSIPFALLFDTDFYAMNAADDNPPTAFLHCRKLTSLTGVLPACKGQPKRTKRR